MHNPISLFTGESPQHRSMIEQVVDGRRRPYVLSLVPNLEAASEANPGVDEQVATNFITPNPDVILEDLNKRQQLRDMVAGNDLLAPVLVGDTTQADWDERLTQMQQDDTDVVDIEEYRREKQIEESRRIINQETQGEHRSAA